MRGATYFAGYLAIAIGLPSSSAATPTYSLKNVQCGELSSCVAKSLIFAFS
jgi:hypothetical protein